jgi:hypothetical protein
MYCGSREESGSIQVYVNTKSFEGRNLPANKAEILIEI